ncbi:MAG: hypothetical protein JWQ01_4686 [Massilia sp.]|nr:hypothetical protein [Massilia sp.]
MPITASFPRVSGEVRNIRGGQASTIALAGRALRGPVNQATALWRFADFERTFGGLWEESRLGFEVRDFFRNGGVQAIVVRLYHPLDPARSHAALNANGLLLAARTPGAWGNALRARIDHNIVPSDSRRFNLTVRDGGTGKLEIFRNLSIKGDDGRRVDAVLARESNLVTALLPSARPAAHANLAPAATPPRIALWAENMPATSSAVGALADDGAALEVTDFTGPIEFDGEKGRYLLRDADFFKLLRT